MRKRSFGLRIAALFACLAFVGSSFSTLVFGYFFYRDPSRLGSVAITYVPAFALLALVHFFIYYFALKKPQRAIDRIDSGESLELPQRRATRDGLQGLSRFVLIINSASFGVLPVALVTYRVATKQTDLSESLLLVLFSVAVGLSCGAQQMAASEIILRKEKAKLGIHDLEGIKKDYSISVRVLYSAISSVALSASSLIVAGMGIYREYARWVAAKGVDTVSSASKAAYGAAEGTVLVQLLLLMLVTIAWSAIAMALSVKNMSGQLSLLEEKMEEIASGSSDLTQRAPIEANDDIGRLTAGFNKVLGKVHGLLASVKGTSASVSESSHRLDDYVSQAEDSLSSFEDSSARVRSSVESQGQSVERSREIVTSLSSSIERIAADVANQASHVAQSSASVEEMAANIGSVNKSAEKAGELTRALSELSDSGLAVVQDTLKGMAEIQEASDSVRDIIGSISKIASQTNLLAMNAAIEAAHAGAAGTGFAVVADEVRSLAETSSKSSKEIIGVIKAMDAKIADGARQAEKTQGAFSDIAAAVRGTSEIVHSIVSAMAEQSQGAHEILASVKSLTEATESIKDQASSQEALSSDITEAIEDIVRKAAVIEEAIQDQVGSLQSLSRVVRMVSEESGINKSGVESLDKSLGGFSV